MRSGRTARLRKILSSRPSATSDKRLGKADRLALRTLPRRGYMLAINGSDCRPGPFDRRDGRNPDIGVSSTSSAMPHLSIVVLPFANIGGDLEQEYFVDGVTDSLTTDLSRIAGAFVIGRNTAFTFKGKAVDVREIGRELNVRYVLEGSVQRGGNRFRLNVQLTDTETGAQVWAERFDKPAADLLDMQDEIVSRLANTLNAELIKAEARRAERSLRPDSMDLYFQGRAFLNKGITPALMARARDFFVRALALDSDNIEAAVAAAHVDFAMGSSPMTDDGPAHFRAAENALNSVLLRAPNHPRAHMLLGAVQIRTNRAAKGIAECRQALALDRNLADAHGFIGLGKHALGRDEEVEGHIQEALRLSPRDTRAFLWFMIVGMAKLHANADIEALDRRTNRSGWIEETGARGLSGAQAGFRAGGRISFASFRRFWAVAARRNSSRAPKGPLSLRRSRRRMRFRCANSISIFFRSRRDLT